MTPFTVILGLEGHVEGNARVSHPEDRGHALAQRTTLDFGPACIIRLQERWRFSDRVRLLAGAADDPRVAAPLAEARALILFEEGAYGLAPGTLHVVQGRKVAESLGPDVSVGAARMALVGCQTGTAQQVSDQVDPGVEVALTILRAWGVCPQPGRTSSGAGGARARQPEAVG